MRMFGGFDDTSSIALSASPPNCPASKRNQETGTWSIIQSEQHVLKEL